MFWGLSMEPQKRYTQVVSESFHISQAAVDVTSITQENAPTQVILEFESNDFLLATLSKNAKIFQVSLDLNFMKGDHVSFRTVGPGIVHLSGYHVYDDDDDLESRLLAGEDSDDDEEEEEEIDTSGAESPSGPPGKRKKIQPAGKNKKSKLDDSDDDDDEDDSFGSTLGDSTLLDLEAEGESDDDEDEDNDDLGEEEEEDDSDSDDEQPSDDEDEVEEQTSKKGKALKLNGTASPATNKVNKNLLNNSKKEVKTPKSEVKKEKKSLNQSKQEKTPKAEKTPKQEKTPKGANTSANAASPKQKKVLEGGVIAEDLKVGEGPVAKPGKMAQVFYVGRLKSNNKQFDASTSGPGFKFRIGRGEVIRGWDVGVAGMKVGGKRRLTVPAGFAYGAKGSPPTIPPNATLVFDVELRGVS